MGEPERTPAAAPAVSCVVEIPLEAMLPVGIVRIGVLSNLANGIF